MTPFKNTMAAGNALDEALMDALAIVIALRAGLEGAQLQNDPCPYEAENLRRVLGVVFDMLTKAEAANDFISAAHPSGVLSAVKRA